MALVLCLFTTNESKTQLPANSVGIGTIFSSGVSGLSLAYAFSQTFD